MMVDLTEGLTVENLTVEEVKKPTGAERRMMMGKEMIRERTGATTRRDAMTDMDITQTDIDMVMGIMEEAIIPISFMAGQHLALAPSAMCRRPIIHILPEASASSCNRRSCI